MMSAQLIQALKTHCVALLKRYRNNNFLCLPNGQSANVIDGYIPLLVNFTIEDQAAKGLRKFNAATEPQPAVYITAIDVAMNTSPLLLLGERASGKTGFALNLALHLAGDFIGLEDLNNTKLARAVPRNEIGAIESQNIVQSGVIPVYIAVSNPETFAQLLQHVWPDIADVLESEDWANSQYSLLIMLDGVDRLGIAGSTALADAVEFCQRYDKVRLTVLGNRAMVTMWAIPVEYTRHELLPLLQSQRSLFARTMLAKHDLNPTAASRSPLAANPGLFMLSLWVDRQVSTAEELVDQWLDTAINVSDGADVKLSVTSACLDAMINDTVKRLVTHDALGHVPAEIVDVIAQPFVAELLAARRLYHLPAKISARLFHAEPDRWTATIESLGARRLASNKPLAPLINSLLGTDTNSVSGADQGSSSGLDSQRAFDTGSDGVLRGALLVAAWLKEDAPQYSQVLAVLQQLLVHGRLSASLREQAGRILSRWGDPRDLDALAEVPGGVFTFGSSTHPNSAPPHTIAVDEFRIGIYPVTNSQYRRFIKATGKVWLSDDAWVPERASAPAVDLTWIDACAYCVWLTELWRREGCIGSTQNVRLPSEPEWERAARGDQSDSGDNFIYPWGYDWITDAANSAEAGFNNTCTVGLFPAGRSPYGCFDMTGQVWEWTTTLWGDDMTTPTFRYPYVNDGREALDAQSSIRRVLRGGCFSSDWQKACCTYRGSLEPSGFWRGNGFRIVVSSAEDKGEHSNFYS